LMPACRDESAPWGKEEFGKKSKSRSTSKSKIER
jgi:hypothetical protein